MRSLEFEIKEQLREIEANAAKILGDNNINNSFSNNSNVSSMHYRRAIAN